MGGNVCDEYGPGMCHMVLSRYLAPHLRWVGQVGGKKILLVRYPTWQAFIDHFLAKATKHKGSVIIFTEDAKEKAKKYAQLIASSSCPTTAKVQVGGLTQELEDACKQIRLHKLVAQMFCEHTQTANTGDGTILVCPWDANFLYRLTYSGGWVWAKGVKSCMATHETPPRTYGFLEIMKKARVFHKATKVNN
ncbi:uncharacterized protein MELLADRAFT_84249 [Melampsora larici-populina 98AG31]|uniref:Uncharacterized protein n=1 Tax=Melampsora larici-populina (strain 98AG31 / pathotype 3-4-7) TaxID=747676 RepID=F4RF17_MELLP|nr:uncharacterized protein MELLADRAFT_84249 [Melampsora larici-populina 98AG31]EGG09017.1 hypothetical protein MELLADRAFT_84249 [Melampsora larici-populina 98AG31]